MPASRVGTRVIAHCIEVIGERAPRVRQSAVQFNGPVQCNHGLFASAQRSERQSELVVSRGPFGMFAGEGLQLGVGRVGVAGSAPGYSQEDSGVALAWNGLEDLGRLVLLDSNENAYGMLPTALA